MRAFVKLRGLLASHEDLARKLDALEEKYDGQFRVVFEAIRQMMVIDSTKKRRILFVDDEPSVLQGLQRMLRADEASGENIPIGSRILKVLSDLLHLESRGISKRAALEQMQKQSGSYDPRVLDATFACFDIYLEKSTSTDESVQRIRFGDTNRLRSIEGRQNKRWHVDYYRRKPDFADAPRTAQEL
jgi:hypothetical protein